MTRVELPPDVVNAIGASAEHAAIRVKYKNWKGEVAARTIIPLSIFYGSTEYHKEGQWLLKVWDMGKEDYRTYAVKDILEWFYSG